MSAAANNLPAVQTQQALIKSNIEKGQEEMFKILPSHVNKERFIKSAMLVAYNNEKIQQCTPVSIVAAVYNAAELGLDFTAAKGHAYMVPFGREAKFMPGFRGLMELCRRSGLVKSIEAHVVHSQDTFELAYGTDKHLTHIPFLMGDPGEVIGAYALAELQNGVKVFEFMPLVELKKVRNSSRAKDSGPWTQWTEEMYKKTVVRRLFKYLPSSPDLDKALEADNDLYTLPDGDGRPAPAPMIGPTDTTPEPTTDPVTPAAPPAATPPPRKRRTKAEIEAERMAAANTGATPPPEQTPPPMAPPPTPPAATPPAAPDIF